MKRQSKRLITVNLFALLAVSFTCFFSADTFASTPASQPIQGNTKALKTSLKQARSETSDRVYLSDLDCMSVQVGYGQLVKDQIDNKTPITLRINQAVIQFDKGLFAHAPSTLIYDLSGYDFDYFTTYVGVNSAVGNSGDGVKFYVYTSQDAATWELQTASAPKVLNGNDNADFIDINISGAKYLKLVADQNENNGYDHAVYADARLTKNTYYDSSVKRVSEYDEIIKNNYDSSKPIDEYELTLLQREFVANVQYPVLQDFIKESEANRAAVEWLMNDVDHLRQYITGGKPNGSYENSLRVLSELLTAYESDLSDPQYGAIYQKMIISLSLSHSRSVRYWLSDGVAKDGEIVANNLPTSPNQSNAVERYRLMKKLFLDNKTNNATNQIQFEHAIFESLEVEEMRYLMGTEMADGEIEWLYHIVEERNSKDPYKFIKYSETMVVDYWKEEYYSEENRQKWDDKYHFSDFGIGYEAYIPRLWTVFEEDGVCWQISNLGANIESIHGIPNTVVGQPEHLAYLVYSLNDKGEGVWTLNNDVTGWSRTNDAGYSQPNTYYPVRWINGWGNGDYASEFMGSYILLGQAAINDFANYEKAKELTLLANTYQGDNEKLEAIYREALAVQNINFDAWLGLVELYANDDTKTDEELYQLEEEIAAALAYYPLPMNDLLTILGEHMDTSAYQAKHSILLKQALEQASTATDNDSIQANAVKAVADYLLQKGTNEIATFSFDGEKAGELSLAERFEGNNVRWDYSLDNGATWTPTSEHAVTLSEAELASITDENNILVHIVGVDYSAANIFTIDIQKATMPDNLYANDLENRMINAGATLQWKKAAGDQWTSFADAEPDLSGDTGVIVRVGAHGIYLPSEEATFTFTAEANTDTEKYVKLSHLSLQEVSSQQASDQAGEKALDGDINTHWHTLWNGTDNDRYLSIAIDRPIYLSALQYVPRKGGGNGTAQDVEVYISTNGTDWELAGSANNWANNGDAKTIRFDEAKQASYVKFVITKGEGNFGSAAMINLFEDITKLDVPVADIQYDHNELTNGTVTATLIDPDGKLTITNNDGKNTYVFEENGSFTFEFKDENGVAGSATATVTWIDKTPPQVHIEYSITDLTNQDVTATLVFDEEDITIENNGGEATYTFDQNGSFTFICKDQAGNETKATAEVTWIDKTPPQVHIEYNITDLTNQDVTATLVFSEEDITVENNGGAATYTFDQNGSFTFICKDKAGNETKATAEVTWIDKTPPQVHIEYNITDLTNQDVTATLVFDEEDITIENNGGKATYTFDQNGSFTFICKDKAGNETKATAEVTWIDKDAPVTSIQYSTKDATTESVTATLISNEEITILNNEGKDTYTFTENGTFEFSYVDKAGNRGTIIAEVDWIREEQENPPVDPDDPNPPVDPDDPNPPVNPDDPTDPVNPETPDIKPVDQLFSEDQKIMIEGGHLQSDMNLITEYIPLQEVNEILSSPEHNSFKLNYTVEKLFDFYLLKDNGTKFELKDEYTMAIQLESNMFGKDLDVIYIADDGKITYMNSWIKNGYIYFNTNHNSMYAIVSKNKANTVLPSNPLPKDDTTIKPAADKADQTNGAATGDDTRVMTWVMALAFAQLIGFYAYCKSRELSNNK